MKNKFWLPAIIVAVITTFIMITTCQQPPPPTVEIRGENLTEDTKTITLCPGCSVSLIAEGTGEADLNYTWNLEGVGKLKHLGGDGAEGRRNDYTAPNSSDLREIIEVSVIDANNQKATDDIIITVEEVSPPPTATFSPSPTLTAMPPTNTPPASASPTPTSTACQPGQPDSFSRTLRILQWKHFVPEYDQWFDEFAKEWGCKNQVNVVVDHIDLFNIAYCLETEIAEYKGETHDFDIESCFNQERKGSEKHDLIEMILPPHQSASDLVDLTQFIENELSLGEQARICRDSSSFIDEESNESDERKYIGLCHGWVPDVVHYRKDLWATVGFPDGPKTYEELLEGGSGIKKNSLEGNIKVGIGLNSKEGIPTLDQNKAIRAIFFSFGAYVQDKNQNVVIDSDETRKVTRYIANLFIKAMDSSVLDWNDKSNNVCLAQNLDCSYIINAISAYRDAQKQKKKTAEDIFLAAPPSGPVDALAPPHLTQVYVVPNFVNSNQQAMVEDFLKAFIMNSEEVMEQSQLYTLSAWPNQFPIPEKLLDDKTKILKEAIAQQQNTDWLGWTRNIGYPGATNAAVLKVFRDNILPNMVVNVAREVQDKPGITDSEYENIIQDEIDEAKEKICAIFLDPETRPKKKRIEGCE